MPVSALAFLAVMPMALPHETAGWMVIWAGAIAVWVIAGLLPSQVQPGDAPH